MKRLFGKWIRKESGTTAIEFSMLLIPYMMLSLGIIELSMMYTTANLLEGATGSAARMVRTGQLQQSGTSDPETAFRMAMCAFAPLIIECSDVVIEVKVLNSYADYTPPVYDEDGNMESEGFTAGGSNDKVLIRTAYRYEMLTPLVGPLLSGGEGSRLFMSTIVLQTEPYEFEGI